MDMSMVVVIDDRLDVWGDCFNLVKVVFCMLCLFLFFGCVYVLI